MLQIVTEIEIDATPEKIWAELMGFAFYPDWNPFIRRIKGTPAVGEQLTVRIEPPEGSGMTFRPRVLVVDESRELRWKGKLLIPGLFDGEHFFTLQPIHPDRTKFVHGEFFSGLLVPLFTAQLRGPTKRGFELMNAALKAKVEAT
jgi:hypothetical protein